MGRIVWFINGFFGTVVGAIVAIISSYVIIFVEFNFEQIGLFIGAVLAFIFGVYQWRKFFKKQ